MAQKLAGQSARESFVEMTQVVLPSDGNPLGTIFGGRVMQWIDLCATVSAMRHCRRIVVTASMDDLHFLAPMHVGEIAILCAQVNRVFHTSLEVGVRVEAEHPLTGERRHCATAYLTFVALDEAGRPVEVPPVIPETEEEVRRYEAAAIRREERLRRRGRRPRDQGD
ncbi:MAG: acyl-CoA thioesterase [Anaerolineae bacterium]